jgi:alkylation response protein AidB-like acyl-CoA dehydrogenase
MAKLYASEVCIKASLEAMRIHGGYGYSTEYEIERMWVCGEADIDYADTIEHHVPEGQDKTYLLRKLREVAMWANVCITREPDGTPRK